MTHISDFGRRRSKVRVFVWKGILKNIISYYSCTHSQLIHNHDAEVYAPKGSCCFVKHVRFHRFLIHFSTSSSYFHSLGVSYSLTPLLPVLSVRTGTMVLFERLANITISLEAYVRNIAPVRSSCWKQETDLEVIRWPQLTTKILLPVLVVL